MSSDAEDIYTTMKDDAPEPKGDEKEPALEPEPEAKEPEPEPEPKSDEKEPEAKEPAPEPDKGYEDFKIEGADENIQNDFRDWAKERGIPSEDAKQFLTEMVEKHADTTADFLNEQIEQVVTDWEQQVKQDPELKGPKFEENIELAKRAARKFGGDELIEALEQTKAGSHPALVKAFYRIGKAMSEGDVFVSGGEQPKARDIYETMYPTMTQQKD